MGDTDLIILSRSLIVQFLRNIIILYTSIYSDSWIYTIDQNKWDIGPTPNGYYNYISGICGVVKTNDGNIHLNMKINGN